MRVHPASCSGPAHNATDPAVRENPDQDSQLNSLSSAISRQHALSLRVAEELELHSSLLDDTDEALDRTGSNLRRASGRLDDFTRRARDTGSTGLIIALIILLVILIVIFKF